MVNLSEYAFGLDPLKADSSAVALHRFWGIPGTTHL